MADDTPSRLRLLAIALAVPLGWAVLAAQGVLLLTQLTGWGASTTLVVSVQSLTPYVLAPVIPVIVLAGWFRHRRMLAVGGVWLLCTIVLIWPLVVHDTPADAEPDMPRVQVTHANLYGWNDDPAGAAAAVLGTEADVLALNELSPDVAAALDAGGATDRYPYRVGFAEEGTSGVAVWSRWPVDGEVIQLVARPGIDAVIEVPATDGEATVEMRIVVAHPVPPVHADGREVWVESLAEINELVRSPGPPTLFVGDVNASYWHPPYRRELLPGLTDVHRVLGAGWSVSWPTDRLIIPAFVRLDHALVDDRIVPVSIRDVAVPGSDHDAFIVEIALPAPTPAP